MFKSEMEKCAEMKLTRPPFLSTWFNPSMISNYNHYKEWDEITYPFPNFNSDTVEVWERIGDFILHFTRYEISYPCWD